MADAILQGIDEAKRKLERLGSTVARRAMRSAVNASMTPIMKALRAAINAAPASSQLKREARKLVGKRLGKIKGGPGRGQMQAKVGHAVGKKAQPAKDRAGKKGVGVSSADIHWFVLGTKERKIKRGSVRGPKAGHPTGMIEPPFAGTMQAAAASSQSAALEAARNKLSQILLKEAQRKG